MARDKRSEEEEEGLSPEQRLDSLEKANKRNLIFIVVLGIAAIFFITMKLTYLILGVDEEPAPVMIESLSSDDKSEDKYVDVAQKIRSLEQQLAAQKAFVQSTSNEVLQRNLIEQEKSYQKFLATLDEAIADLANMVPGSRSWLEIHSEEIAKIIQASKKREKTLKTTRVELKESADEMDF